MKPRHHWFHPLAVRLGLPDIVPPDIVPTPAIPVATKATLKLGTSWGEIFVDPEFKIEFDQKTSMIKYSDNVSGKINGGGLDVNLSSTHNNVYLRKK